MISKIIDLTNKILALLDYFLKAKEQKEYKNDTQEIEKNPGDYFDREFSSGLSKHTDKTDLPGSKADNTGKG